MMARHGLAAVAGVVAVALVSVTGCADPAANKPAAEVTRATAPPIPAALLEGEWLVLGTGSSVGFVGSKVTGSHDGGFENIKAEIQMIDRNPEKSTVHLSIDAQSLWTDNPKLTEHLKSADFFDVAQYPFADFRSTEIKKAEGANGYTVTGNLELHGVTKSITFPATITVGEGLATVKSEFSIKRFDFGIVYPGRADDLIRDDVLIKLDLKCVPSSAKPGEAEPIVR